MYYAKIGNKFFDELYIGGQTVSKMYYGEHQVWPIPSGDLVISGVVLLLSGGVVTVRGLNTNYVQTINWGSSTSTVGAGSTEVSHTYSAGESVTISLGSEDELSSGSWGIDGLDARSFDAWGGVVFDPRLDMRDIPSGETLDITGITSIPSTWLGMYKTVWLSELLMYADSLTNIPDSWVGLERVTSAYKMFYGCRDLLAIPDSWEGLNSLETAYEMFYNCVDLVNIPSSWVGLDKLYSVTSMFAGCSSLVAIPDSWDGFGEGVITAQSMFTGCSSLVTIPTSGFEGLNTLRNAGWMFSGCTSLTSDIYPMYLYLLNKGDMNETQYMFDGCINAINYDLVPASWGGGGA